MLAATQRSRRAGFRKFNARIDSDADTDAGTIVTAMILDPLAGRTPRYPSYFDALDGGPQLGPPIRARLGR